MLLNRCGRRNKAQVQLKNDCIFILFKYWLSMITICLEKDGGVYND